MMAESDIASQVSELEDYLHKTEEWFGEFLTAVDWSKDDVQSEDKVQCTLSKHHFVPMSSLAGHVQSCSHVAKGYTKEDLEKDQSSDFFYEKATTVIPVKLEPHILSGLLSRVRMTSVEEGELPQTVERYLQELTPAERLKVYEYCMDTARQVGHLTRISDEELMLLGQGNEKKASGPKSRLALMAKERDLKRRRQSYKGKSVHTGKKSHLQVLREVIESQMELLRPLFTNDQDTPSESGNRQEKADSEQPTSFRSRSRSKDVKPKKKHRKRSRSRSRSRSRDRERSRSRHRKHKKKKHKD